MRGLKKRDQGRGKKLAISLALFLVLGLLLNSLSHVYQKKRDAEEALAQMEREKAELEKNQTELESSLARLNTQAGLDFEIRKRFNVAGAGESVAIIVEGEEQAAAEPQSKSLWQKIKAFFLKLAD